MSPPTVTSAASPTAGSSQDHFPRPADEDRPAHEKRGGADQRRGDVRPEHGARQTMPEQAMDCPSCGNHNREGREVLRLVRTPPGERRRQPQPASSDPAAEPDGRRAGSPRGRDRSRPLRASSELLGSGGRKEVFLAARRARRAARSRVALFETEGVGEAAHRPRPARDGRRWSGSASTRTSSPVFDTGEEDGRPYIVSELHGGRRRRSDCWPQRRRAGSTVERGGADRDRRLPRARARPRPRRRPPRPEAGQRLARPRTARRASATSASPPPAPARGRRDAGRHRRLHAARAGARARDGPALRPLLARARCSTRWSPAGRRSSATTRSSIIGQHLNADPVAASCHNPEVPAALETLIARLLAKARASAPRRPPRSRERLEAIRDAPPEAAARPSPRRTRSSASRAASSSAASTSWQQLRAAADEALAGRGRLVLLVGEPGIGKTRTSRGARDLRARPRGQGALGPLPRGEGAPAYWPWVQVIRSYVARGRPGRARLGAGRGRRRDRAHRPRARRARSASRAARRGDDEEARFRLFDAISTFLANAAASRPLVLVLDDLHWADEPSLLLLQFLARELATARCSSSAPTATSSSAATTRSPGARRARAARATSPRRAARPRRPRRRAATSRSPPGPSRRRSWSSRRPRADRGQPVLRHRGRPPAGERGPPRGRRAGAAAAIPQGVRDVVGRRLDRLSPEANDGAAVRRR